MRVAFAGLLALLAASLVAGCGGDTLSLDPVADAATKTEAAKSMRLELTIAASTPGAGPAMKVTAAGEVDGDRSRLTMSVPPFAGVGLGTFELRSDADALYLRMPFLQAVTPAAKPWLKLDLDDVGENAVLNLNGLLELGRQSNPAQALEYLRAAGDVKKVGTARVRGVETTHYRAVVDLERLAQNLGAPGVGVALREVMDATGATTMPVELWVDDESLVRRMTWTQQLPIRPGREPSEISLSLDLFDFGADVDIDLPSPDETVPFGGLWTMGETG